MATNEEASPICRGKNLSWETVMLFFNYMPKEPLPKDKFNAYVEKHINGWTQTHSQIARQLAFYYEEKGICYPRFTKDSTLSDLFKYIVHWAHNYFIPNPYAPSLKGNNPTSIYFHLIECIKSGKNNFDEALDSIFDIKLSSHDKVRVYLQNYTNIKFQNGEISLNESIVDNSYILSPTELEAQDAKAYYLYYSNYMNYNDKPEKEIKVSIKASPFQQIYYGAPGTGKSHTINKITKDWDVIRTTFHPDSDYSTFVGAYKPTVEMLSICDEAGQPVKISNIELQKKQITYKFVRQAFLNAYLSAWKKYAEGQDGEVEPQFLIIEEINRGNCAQIFGDIFQLLDRADNGFSSYPIVADDDIRKSIEQAFNEDKDYKIEQLSIEGAVKNYKSNYGDNLSVDVRDGRILLLPPNLYIWATMNTSDQSLFPIDSAFKRRWDWKYIKISNAYAKDDSGNYKTDEQGNKIPLGWKIKIDETYEKDWWEFLEKINAIISNMTSSADKQLGYFFCKADEKKEISAEKFVSKVVFYLWNDVFKDYGFEDSSLFLVKVKDHDGKDIDKDLTYPNFFDEDGNVDVEITKQFVDNVMNWSKKNENNL